jgi:DNA-binding response OmpR family regulator
VAEILMSEGYAVELAGSGEAGLAAARASPPDVLLLDLLLPGMDGASMLEEVRKDQLLAGVRVVVTTGMRASHLRRLLKPDAILFKPFGMGELLSVLARLTQPKASS